MNSAIKEITNNFPLLEGCYLLDQRKSDDSILSTNKLTSPWIKWALETSESFKHTRIHLKDSSHLLLKRLDANSILVIHNREENPTLVMNFIKCVELAEPGTTDKSPAKKEAPEPNVDLKMMDAVRIQKLIIPKQEDIKKEFKNFFVVHQQQDVVGGDFYWYARKDDNVLLAIVDCTGHSMEGAMTSMVCNSLLNQSFADFDPNNSLSELLVRFYLQIVTYNQTTSDVGDYGMGAEVGLFNFNYKKETVTFCSTGISAFIKRTNGIEHLKSKKIINYQNIDQSINEISFKMDGIIGIYGFTDGLIDQFDSKDKKKLGRRGILKMIEREKQFNADYYLSEINKWKGDNMQYDDITLVGIAI